MTKSEFQFASPYLTKLNFKRNMNFCAESDEVEIENAFHVEVKRDEQKSEANVELSLAINGKEKDAPFQLLASIASDFTWEQDGMDEKTLEAMLNCNAPALLLGYLRPIVASVTDSSGVPAYHLPLINFTK